MRKVHVARLALCAVIAATLLSFVDWAMPIASAGLSLGMGEWLEAIGWRLIVILACISLLKRTIRASGTRQTPVEEVWQEEYDKRRRTTT